jgi:regulator of sigma E protease
MPPELVRAYSRGPLEALGASVARAWDLSLFTLKSIKKMLMGLISPKNLSGPITIAKVATASAKSGLESYISFLALLSVSLGVLNLLPIPVLDGGHLLFYTIELLAGRPVPEKIQSAGYQLGLFMVLGIMVLALYNDFTRL